MLFIHSYYSLFDPTDKLFLSRNATCGCECQFRLVPRYHEPRGLHIHDHLLKDQVLCQAMVTRSRCSHATNGPLDITVKTAVHAEFHTFCGLACFANWQLLLAPRLSPANVMRCSDNGPGLTQTLAWEAASRLKVPVTSALSKEPGVVATRACLCCRGK